MAGINGATQGDFVVGQVGFRQLNLFLFHLAIKTSLIFLFKKKCWLKYFKLYFLLE